MSRKFILISALLSIILLLELSCTSFSQDNNDNFKIAYIDKANDSLVITVTGQRRLMAHDPISALKDGKYVDSAKFMIPVNKNFAGKGQVRAVGFGYPIDSGGILIKKDTVRIDLYFNEYDRHKITSTGWNGTYVIFWRNKTGL